MSSQKGIRRNTRFESDFNNEVEAYQKLHKIKTWNKALHLRDKENLQKIEELTSEVTSLKKKNSSVFNFMQKKSLSEDTPLDKDMSISTSTEISEKPCSFMVYVKNEPKCADPDAPIDSYLKKHLNSQICALCQKLKREKENNLQKKEDEDHEKALAKAKEETRKAVEQLNKRSRGRDEYAGSRRVNYDTCAPNGAPDSW
jgi:hypothetical protein